jgi:hypothetical protein
MALTKITKCPITPECSKRILYIDVPLEDVTPENVFAINVERDMVQHVCTYNRPQGKPETAYLGVWLNKRSKRTRYMGPFRTRAQAEKTPKDDHRDPSRRDVDEWKLLETCITELKWKKAPPRRS